VTGAKPLPAEVLAQAGPLPPLAIPATLHDPMMARLDRLAPVKEAAQPCLRRGMLRDSRSLSSFASRGRIPSQLADTRLKQRVGRRATIETKSSDP
jgi:hypothetical protein